MIQKDYDGIVRVPMKKAVRNLFQSLQNVGQTSPYAFYQAYRFIETFSYKSEDLLEFESLIIDEIKRLEDGSEHWRLAHDIRHAVRAQKAFDWSTANDFF